MMGEDVRRAGFENIEKCPFCEFALIMEDENDRVFRCQNEDCLKESCRECKEESHIPLRCDEVMKADEAQMQNYVANKMSEAMVRVCPKCDKRLIKSAGCNKLICPCGAFICYVCSQLLDRQRPYDHFDQGRFPRRGDPLGPGTRRRCPMTTTMEQVHADVAERAGKEAREKFLRDHPEMAEGGKKKVEVEKMVDRGREAGGDHLAGMMYAVPAHWDGWADFHPQGFPLLPHPDAFALHAHAQHMALTQEQARARAMDQRWARTGIESHPLQHRHEVLRDQRALMEQDDRARAIDERWARRGREPNPMPHRQGRLRDAREQYHADARGQLRPIADAFGFGGAFEQPEEIERRLGQAPGIRGQFFGLPRLAEPQRLPEVPLAEVERTRPHQDDAGIQMFGLALEDLEVLDGDEDQRQLQRQLYDGLRPGGPLCVRIRRIAEENPDAGEEFRVRFMNLRGEIGRAPRANGMNTLVGLQARIQDFSRAVNQFRARPLRSPLEDKHLRDRIKHLNHLVRKVLAKNPLLGQILQGRMDQLQRDANDPDVHADLTAVVNRIEREAVVALSNESKDVKTETQPEPKHTVENFIRKRRGDRRVDRKLFEKIAQEYRQWDELDETKRQELCSQALKEEQRITKHGDIRAKRHRDLTRLMDDIRPYAGEPVFHRLSLGSQHWNRLTDTQQEALICEAVQVKAKKVKKKPKLNDEELAKKIAKFQELSEKIKEAQRAVSSAHVAENRRRYFQEYRALAAERTQLREQIQETDPQFDQQTPAPAQAVFTMGAQTVPVDAPNDYQVAEQSSHGNNSLSMGMGEPGPLKGQTLQAIVRAKMLQKELKEAQKTLWDAQKAGPEHAIGDLMKERDRLLEKVHSAEEIALKSGATEAHLRENITHLNFTEDDTVAATLEAEQLTHQAQAEREKLILEYQRKKSKGSSKRASVAIRRVGVTNEGALMEFGREQLVTREVTNPGSEVNEVPGNSILGDDINHLRNRLLEVRAREAQADENVNQSNRIFRRGMREQEELDEQMRKAGRKAAAVRNKLERLREQQAVFEQHSEVIRDEIRRIDERREDFVGLNNQRQNQFYEHERNRDALRLEITLLENRIAQKELVEKAVKTERREAAVRPEENKESEVSEVHMDVDDAATAQPSQSATAAPKEIAREDPNESLSESLKRLLRQATSKELEDKVLLAVQNALAQEGKQAGESGEKAATGRIWHDAMASSGCPHCKNGINFAAIQRRLSHFRGHQALGRCDLCVCAQSETGEDERGVWVCLRCGHQGCGRDSHHNHALHHFQTRHPSGEHSIVVHLSSFLVWCYECDNEVPGDHTPVLAETLKKLRDMLSLARTLRV